MTKPHKHRALPGKSRTFGYCGYQLLPPDKSNPSAQGGVTIYDYCRCGAKRMTNSTGSRRRTEFGPWVEPEKD